MTAEELAWELEITEQYLIKRFKYIQKSKKKQNIEIIKVGRGEKSDYGIKYPWDKEIQWRV